MSRNRFQERSTRRAVLPNAGPGPGIAILPATLARFPTMGKDEAMHDIMHLLKIHAASERVYQAITTAEGLRQWWTRDAGVEPLVGSVGEFGFYARRFVAQVTVEELNPAVRVRWKVANGAWPAPDIEFNLRADGNDTTLFFAHGGFPRANEAFASATTRWGFYLLSLKRYLQTGTGTPNPDDSEGLG